MGSRSTQKTEIPQYIEDAGKIALQRAIQLQEMGPLPYMGPDVAMMDPAVAQNVSSMASEFGLAGPSPMPSMPTVSYGGISGYSAYPAYLESMQALQAARPDQYGEFSGMFKYDPITGMLNPNFVSNMPVYGGNTASNMPVYSGNDDDGPSMRDIMAERRLESQRRAQGFVNNDGFIDAPYPSSGPSLGGLVSGITGAVSDFREARDNAIRGLLGVD